ncbi:MAG TPA: cupin domain-containing protein [Acidimicrobiales bacterium]|nr:cupin domain-containing protein [Acidimicrobiales bacterium]
MSFIDQSGAPPRPVEWWDPIVVRREDIDAEIERLTSRPRPDDGRRRSVLAHPMATEPGLGLAPGIEVALEVLLPGEATSPIRHNSTSVGFCLHGAGEATVGGVTFDFDQYDVWCTPSMAPYTYRNTSTGIHARLAYSNAPLLEKMRVHVVETDFPPPEAMATVEEGDRSDIDHLIDLDGGAQLLSYERLIDPPRIESKPLHWRWTEVKARLDKLHALGESYKGRRLYLLYNPSTGRTNGTTFSFFATMCLRPADIVDRPHRHVAAAINYFFSGEGDSLVAGRRYEWRAGDLMLTAPGWAIHRHASHGEDVYELTIQDSPLNLAMDSLLWQEDLKHPPRMLGTSKGFATNRRAL